MGENDKITVDVVEGAEWSEHVEEGEAVLEASLFDGRSGEDHHDGSDLFQQHLPQRRARRIHRHHLLSNQLSRSLCEMPRSADRISAVEGRL